MGDRKFRSESIDKMEELFAHTDERVLMAQKVLNMCWAQIIQDVHFSMICRARGTVASQTASPHPTLVLNACAKSNACSCISGV